MSDADRFFDTNILLYLLSADDARADRAEELVAGGGVISVQVLNEFAAVASRKLGMPVPEIRETLAAIRSVCRVVPLGEETHDLALQLAERYGLSVYDCTILAAALQADCKVVLSEDMQHGQVVNGRLEIHNPFL